MMQRMYHIKKVTPHSGKFTIRNAKSAPKSRPCTVKSPHDMMKIKHLVTRRVHHIVQRAYRII